VHRPRGLVVVLVIASLGVGPSLLASCGTVECSIATGPGTGYDASFVGRLTGRHADTATFTVESTKTFRTENPDGPIPKLTASVAVEYPDDVAHFLHVGKRYLVNVEWSGTAFESDIHRAGDCGSGGTLHADGSPIDTSTFPWLHRALLAGLVTPVVALLVLVAVVWYRRRRHRRPVVVDR
jgi:hypothetical protein